MKILKMKREREPKPLDLNGFPYGLRPKVYDPHFDKWYDGIVVDANKDQVKVRRFLQRGSSVWPCNMAMCVWRHALRPFLSGQDHLMVLPAQITFPGWTSDEDIWLSKRCDR